MERLQQTEAATPPEGWPEGVREIRFISTADSTEQPALFYAPRADEPALLLVGLHTWSGNYLQATSAPYAKWCIERGWAFIHPDFRGPNWTPPAAGSDLVVQDIIDAVEYARKNANVDGNRVYLVGASGGGHASLLMAGRAPEIWAGVSAWVGISDIKAWYEECTKAGRGYANHVVKACGGTPGTDPAIDEDCRKRSPLTYLAEATDVSLDINAGITDGHNGSVPISHSLRAFNAVAKAEDRLSEEEIDYFTQKAEVPPHLKQSAQELADSDYGAKVPLFRRTSGKARITIFKGGHEIIFEAALNWLAKQRKE